MMGAPKRSTTHLESSLDPTTSSALGGAFRRFPRSPAASDVARELLLIVIICLCWHRIRPNDTTTLAYVGPGAGFAFIGSFLSLIAGALLGTFSLLTWPVRVTWRLLRRGRAFRYAAVKKIIFLGLDGLDPRLTEQFMREGKLPNLSKLLSTGSYSQLRTTFPSLSPVAWSTFATGVNPAKHNIF